MSALRYRWLLLPVVGVLMAAVPTDNPAPVDPAADLQRNRQLLEKWRSDPEHYARLRRDLRAFWVLPADRRQRLRRLDHDLHQLAPATQKRLWRVAERYSAWLERLPDSQRRQIEEAEPHERLRLIKDIRERQWEERLPRKVRDDLHKLPVDKRAVRVAQLHKEERQHRIDWQRPIRPRPVRPGRLNEFPRDVQDFVRDALLPCLDETEKKRLRDAEGKWPLLAQTILQLAEQHPILPPLPAPPGKKTGAITRYEDLSEKAKQVAGPKGHFEKLKNLEGRWPAWALAFHNHLTPPQRKEMPPLGASRPGEFPPKVQAFLDTTLRKHLNQRESQRLRNTRGKWPEYPRLLLELAHRHNLAVPGMSLPGSRELWDSARNP